MDKIGEICPFVFKRERNHQERIFYQSKKGEEKRVEKLFAIERNVLKEYTEDTSFLEARNR